MKQYNKWKISILRFALIIAFLIIWEITANAGIIDAFIFSSPSRIIHCFKV